MVRILIVEDHDYFRSQLRSFLESVDEWTVCEEASDGLKGVEHMLPSSLTSRLWISKCSA